MRTEIQLHERFIAIVATKATKEELANQIDWKQLGLDFLIVGNVGIIFKGAKELFKGKNINSIYKKKIPYPVFDLNFARKNFRFPPQHPKDGVVYACCEIEPDLYIPLASFHTYMYQSKMSAFSEMCASLGAKTCRIIYEEENGKVITMHGGAENIPTNAGTVSGRGDLAKKSNHKQDATFFLAFLSLKKLLNSKVIG